VNFIAGLTAASIARSVAENKKALPQPIGLFVLTWNASDRFNADRLLVQWAATTELYLTVDFRKQGMVTSDPHVVTGVHLCASLPDDNASGGDDLTAIAFYAKPLGIGITPVA
jgi:hypothetical protein